MKLIKFDICVWYICAHQLRRQLDQEILWLLLSLV